MYYKQQNRIHTQSDHQHYHLLQPQLQQTQATSSPSLTTSPTIQYQQQQQHHHHHHHQQQQQQQQPFVHQQRITQRDPLDLEPPFDPYFYPVGYESHVIPYEHTYHYFPRHTNANNRSQSSSSSSSATITTSSPIMYSSAQTTNATSPTTGSGNNLAGVAVAGLVSSNNNVDQSYIPPQSQGTNSNNNSNYNNSNNTNNMNNLASTTQTRHQILHQSNSNINANNNQSPNSPKLIWLLFMHRHGDRTPINMAPRDPYNNITFWPEGFGNLNNAGRSRMFKLGRFIRKRYSHIFTDNPRELYTRSSDVDRCIESAQALLAGLYPPNKYNHWHPQLLWTPTPVHTYPPYEDYLLNEAGRKYLENYIKEIHIIQKSDAVKQLYAESVRERELLERELGYDFDMFTKFKCTFSTLDIEEREGLQMPNWYTPELKEKLYRYSGLAFKLAGSGTEKLKKIRSGPLLEDIIERMEMATIEGPMVQDHSDEQTPTNAPNNGIHDRRIVHFSTHDSIITIFLEALGINEPTPIPPGFGATVFLELYVDRDDDGAPIGEKYIKFFYLDDTTSENPIEKKLPPSCKLNDKGQVTLKNFKKFVANLLPSNHGLD